MKINRKVLNLSNEQKEMLEGISRSRTESLRHVQRAKILLLYSQNVKITEIKMMVNIGRNAIYKCINKSLESGIESALDDMPRHSKKPIITKEAKLFVTNIACKKPKDFGYAAELWSYQSLANHVRKNAELNGFDCLKKAVKATVYRILEEKEIKPHKVRYYLEKRDTEFEEKMRDILITYQEVNFKNEGICENNIITVSVDEKPGIQAIGNIAPDLSPDAEKCQSTWKRDYEYKRLGTVSLIAALDLHDGHITARVEDRHRSCEFISLLKDLDNYYPKNAVIKLILDNHSSHISKETKSYLETVPGRFVYVHTPKHGSWLNIIETFFGKAARTFLKYIRVSSIDELKNRILKGIDEINLQPVVHRWRNFDF